MDRPSVRSTKIEWKKVPKEVNISGSEKGIRTPDGLPWAPSLDDLYIPPGSAFPKCTASMVREAGGLKNESGADRVVEHTPHLLAPWPLLERGGWRSSEGVDGPSGNNDAEGEGCPFLYPSQKSNENQMAEADRRGFLSRCCSLIAAESFFYSAKLATEFVNTATDSFEYPFFNLYPPLQSSTARQVPDEAVKPLDGDPAKKENPTRVDSGGHRRRGSFSMKNGNKKQPPPSVSIAEQDGTGNLGSADNEKTASNKQVKDAATDTERDTSKDRNGSPSVQVSTLPEPPVPFSSEFERSLPKLEEFIPPEAFPSRLIVNDPLGIIFPREYQHCPPGAIKVPRRAYKRVFPDAKSPVMFGNKETGDERESVGFLNLEGSLKLGTGNHSVAYSARLRLPPSVKILNGPGEVSVAAKLAFLPNSERELLKHEAVMYNEFPTMLTEGYCGYNVVPKVTLPVPAGPIVPKFYGYYVPEDVSCLEGCSEEDCGHVDPSPILLMEECGVQVNPERLSVDEWSECSSLLFRFNHCGYVHRSAYRRNFVVQPGPLTHPPSERSLETPSFRLIDHGRTMKKRCVERDENGEDLFWSKEEREFYVGWEQNWEGRWKLSLEGESERLLL